MGIDQMLRKGYGPELLREGYGSDSLKDMSSDRGVNAGMKSEHEQAAMEHLAIAHKAQQSGDQVGQTAHEDAAAAHTRAANAVDKARSMSQAANDCTK
jgi:hypothetical protein